MDRKNFFYLLIAFLFTVSQLEAITLTGAEVSFTNEIAKWLDSKPDKKGLELCNKAFNSKNILLKGLASIILYKHYRGKYEQVCENCFTMNKNRFNFEEEKRITVKIENLKRLLNVFNDVLLQLKDERIRKLFLFYHFRQKNVIILGKYNEELSLAGFYRLAFLSEVFKGKDEYIVDELVKNSDR